MEGASGYFTGYEDIPPAVIRALFESCRRNNTPFILDYDANAHNIIWGSTDTNTRSEQLFDFILKSNLNIFTIRHSHNFVNMVR